MFLHSRRIITLGPVMLIPEEQPAQPALPVQPDGTRVVCGHCGNTFLVSKASDPPSRLTMLSKLFVVSSLKSIASCSGIIEELKTSSVLIVMDVWSVFGYLYMCARKTFNSLSVHG